jgi:hypothetical protein
MAGVQMDQCTDGAFRAGHRQCLSADMRSCSVLHYAGYVTALPSPARLRTERRLLDIQR